MGGLVRPESNNRELVSHVLSGLVRDCFEDVRVLDPSRFSSKSNTAVVVIGRGGPAKISDLERRKAFRNQTFVEG